MAEVPVSAEQRIRELGLSLPSGSAPAANYANAVRTGNERGVHARSVLGASSLRGGLPVILKAVVEVVP